MDQPDPSASFRKQAVTTSGLICVVQTPDPILSGIIQIVPLKMRFLSFPSIDLMRRWSLGNVYVFLRVSGMVIGNPSPVSKAHWRASS